MLFFVSLTFALPFSLALLSAELLSAVLHVCRLHVFRTADAVQIKYVVYYAFQCGERVFGVVPECKGTTPTAVPKWYLLLLNHLKLYMPSTLLIDRLTWASAPS